MKTTIPVCSPKTDCNEMYKILQEAGCLVVRGVANQQTLNAVRSELSEYLDVAKVEDDDPNASYSGGTRRVIALMHRSPTVRQLMIDPIVEQLGDQLPEHQTLSAALHQIRLAFVEVQNQPEEDE